MEYRHGSRFCSFRACAAAAPYLYANLRGVEHLTRLTPLN